MDKKKMQITDEGVTRRMQDMLHGGEPRQFEQPVAGGFRADLSGPAQTSTGVDPRPDDGRQDAQPKYDVDWLLSQYDEMRRDDEAEARRQKSRDMVNGIADMARALVDLYHTDRYAPSQEVDKSLMSDVSRKRYDKAKAERDKRRAEYLNYVQNVSKQRNAEEGYRLQHDANRLRERSIVESERHHKEQEDYNRARIEMEAAKQQWKELLADKQLSLKEKIAMMNDATRRWSTSMRLSQAAIAHTLQPYIVTEEDMYDKDGRKIGKKKTRLIIDNNGNVKDIKTEEERGTTTTTNTTTTQGSGKAPSGWNSNTNSTSTTKKSNKSGRSPQGW